MAVPIIYRWDDVGAPSLSGGINGPTNWVAVLKACLVTGYGSKAAAGWSEQFNNGASTKAVFQPANLEFGLVVDDTYATSASSYQAADSFTDINTPVGAWNTTQYLSKSNSTSISAYRCWMVLASSSFFLAIVWTNQVKTTPPTPEYSLGTSVIGVGRYIPYILGTSLPNITIGLNSTFSASFSTVFPMILNLDPSFTREITIQRGTGGGTTTNDRRGRALFSTRMIYANTAGYVSSQLSGTGGNTFASFEGGNYLYAPFWVCNYMGHILGEVPLVRGIVGAIPVALRNQLIQDVVIDGKTWMLVCTDTAYDFINRSYYLFDAYTDSLP